MSRVVAFNAARVTLRSQRWANLPRVQAVGPALLRLYASKSLPQHTIIDMPALSPTMTQGGVGAWNKKPGDKLEPGDVLVEIETDKAQMDFEFQDEGYLAKILMETGAKDIPVGKPIGVFVEDEGDVSAFSDFTLEDALAESGAAPTSSEAPKKEKKEPQSKGDDEKRASTPSPPPPKSSGDSPASEGRIVASPLARKIASEQGVPLKNIKGTGPEGRIIKVDVEKYLSSKPATSTAAAPSPRASAPSEPAAQPEAAYTDIPITTMRKVIAERLQESKRNSPHYFVTTTMDVSKLLKLRESLNSTADGRYRLSVNDLLMKAVSKALLEVPQANSAWLGNEGVIRQYTNVDLSVAVATPTGLITPIVRNINQLGLATISNTIKELGKRARAGKLQPQEYQGGTFTISNLGMNHAVSNFTAVINPPQSGILAVGTTERRAIEDPTSESGVSFTSVITCSASFDHRVVDGAVGGEFVKALKQSVENPLELLL